MDFFFDEKEENAQQKNEVNSSLPPSNSEKRKKWKKRLVAIGIAVASFAVGGVATWFSLDKEMRTLIKVKNGIDKNYYKEITDDHRSSVLPILLRIASKVSSLMSCSILQASSRAISSLTPSATKNSVSTLCRAYIFSAILSPA